MVELCIRKIGQMIANPTNIFSKGFLRRQQETVIGHKQFLCVFAQIAVSECSYYLDWNTIHHSRLPVFYLLLWLLMVQTMGSGCWVFSPQSPFVLPSYMPSFGEKD